MRKTTGRKPFAINPHAMRTVTEIRDELERRGICRISRMRVHQILQQAEQKILAGLSIATGERTQ